MQSESNRPIYENLIGEMAKKKIKNKNLADLLHIHENTVSNKINGGSFSIEEAFQIKYKYFPDFEMEYLFEKTVPIN